MDTLKFQRLHQRAILPTRGSKHACGLDIYAIEDAVIEIGKRRALRTGLVVEVPYGFYGRVAPRSGLALKQGIDILAGVIDPDYRGELICVLVNFGENDVNISAGDRIAQLLIEKVATLEPIWHEMDTLTERHMGAFGSTGR